MKEYSIHRNFITLHECDILYNRVLETEERIKSDFPYEAYYQDGKSFFSDSNALGGRASQYNWLDDPVVDNILQPALRNLFPSGLNVRCWANSYKKNDSLGIHSHYTPDPTKPNTENWACTILYCGGPTTGTWFNFQVSKGVFENVCIENNRGDLILFNSDVPHWVEAHQQNGIRVSFAIDVCDSYSEDRPGQLRKIK